jgi:hypothetical protein
MRSVLRRDDNSRAKVQNVCGDSSAADHTWSAQIKHPGRDLYGSMRSLFLETAPRHGLPVLDENLVHHDRAPEPGMPRITDFSRLSIVGVALFTSTTGTDHIERCLSCHLRQSARRSRRHRSWATLGFCAGIVSAVSFTSTPWQRDKVFAPYRHPRLRTSRTSVFCAVGPVQQGPVTAGARDTFFPSRNGFCHQATLHLTGAPGFGTSRTSTRQRAKLSISPYRCSAAFSNTAPPSELACC